MSGGLSPVNQINLLSKWHRFHLHYQVVVGADDSGSAPSLSVGTAETQTGEIIFRAATILPKVDFVSPVIKRL